MCHHIVKKIAWLIVVIGALNWGLIGFFNLNLVTSVFKTGMGSKIVYDLVGIAAVVLVLFKISKMAWKMRMAKPAKARARPAKKRRR